MKKVFYFAIAAVAMLAVSCVKEKFVPEMNVVGTETTVSLDPAASSFTFTVSSNVDFSVKSSAEWLTVSPAGNTITDKQTHETPVVVNVAENADFSADRSATITVEATDLAPVVINVTQTKKLNTVVAVDENGAPIANYSITVKSFDATTYKPVVTFNLSSDANWTATAPEWITLSQSEGTVEGTSVTEITATIEYNDGEARKGEIVVKGGNNGDYVIPVVQEEVFKLEVKAGAVTDKTGEVIPNCSEGFVWASLYSTTEVAEEEFAQKLVARVQQYLDIYVNKYHMYTVESLLATIACVGPDPQVIKGLKANTKYYVIAQGLIIPDGEKVYATSTYSGCSFTTSEAAASAAATVSSAAETPLSMTFIAE